MFGSFSWSGYLWFVATVLLTYFSVLAILYYNKEIRNLFRKKDHALQEMIDRPVTALNDPMRMVHELVSELGLLIRNAAEDKTMQPELHFAIKRAVKNYLILRPTQFHGKINQYIKDELEIRGLQPFSDDQLTGIWND